MKLYKKDELIKKYQGKFINVYPHHHKYWNDKIHQYETVYEVRGVKSTIHENYNLPENAVIQ